MRTQQTGREASGRRGLSERGTEEFGRVLAFSDGVFAIAMTLLIVGIAVPALEDADSVGELAESLGDLVPEFVSFFVSFAVIGRYWAAHHAFFAQLQAIDGRLLGLNLVYLMFVAFLPFPTALLGDYFENPLSVAVYATAVAVVSGLEVVLYDHAHRRRLMRRQMPEEVYVWGRLQSLSPVLFFAASIPLAFVSTVAAVALWFGTVPFGVIANRWKPAGADEFF
jgi:uncharacterized membrane protein